MNRYITSIINEVIMAMRNDIIFWVANDLGNSGHNGNGDLTNKHEHVTDKNG